MQKTIDTDEVSRKLRSDGLDLERKRILVTNFLNTDQEKDLKVPPNCEGLGRIRHFSCTTSAGWPPNPLPIEPACKALDTVPGKQLRAQVFQNAVCNWRCWYCYVPFVLLSAHRRHSQWVTAAELLDLHLGQANPPQVIDLTGGQPDLTPEWVPWMLDEIRSRNLEKNIYVWSDDNLSTDFFWRYLSDSQMSRIVDARNYGRVCCFKGFDEESFSFNTRADGHFFSRQFKLFQRFLKLGIDVYAYVTLTSPTAEHISDRVVQFVDRLQQLHTNLPLRTIPLEVQVFTPVQPRLNEVNKRALHNQEVAVEVWNRQIEERFSTSERNKTITEISLSTGIR